MSRNHRSPKRRGPGENRAINKLPSLNRFREHKEDEPQLSPSNYQTKNNPRLPNIQRNRQSPTDFEYQSDNLCVDNGPALQRVENDDHQLRFNRPEPSQGVTKVDSFVRNQATHPSSERTRSVTNDGSASKNPDINILMVGPTGEGKSTFINGLINYIAHDTLHAAENGEMLTVIPSSYVYFTEEGESRTIRLGQENKYERFSSEGQSSTQECRAFVIKIGQRILRIIDTPGLGDTRGIEQDARNLKEIFGTIAQYKHLSGICTVLKPDHQRLNKNFEYCVNEILRHLPISARNNIIFVFTHARETFYRPAHTKILLEALLKKHFKEQNAEIPLTLYNTFLFENGSFRYLALTKEGIRLSDEEAESFEKGWNYSVNESLKFLTHILRCPLHNVQDTISLNDVEQLIRNLPRPLAEIQRQIEANINRAKHFKEAVLNDSHIIDEGIPQLEGHVEELDHPQTVAIRKRSQHPVNKNDGRKVEIKCVCHEECWVKGVQQEFVGDENLELCEVMNPDSGICEKCGNSWRYHMHITYKYISDTTRIRIPDGQQSGKGGPPKLTLADIDRRITALRGEAEQIENAYKELAQYLQDNSLLLFDNAFVKYLEYFIQEEKEKRAFSNENNTKVIENLERMKNDFEKHVVKLKTVLGNLPENDRNRKSPLKPQDIIHLVETLYKLPINGRSIRKQVEIIGMVQAKISKSKEKQVALPRQANNSRIMNELLRLLS